MMTIKGARTVRQPNANGNAIVAIEIDFIVGDRLRRIEIEAEIVPVLRDDPHGDWPRFDNWGGPEFVLGLIEATLAADGGELATR